MSRAEYETTTPSDRPDVPIRLMLDLAGDAISITRQRTDGVTVTLFTVTPKQAHIFASGLTDVADQVVSHRERIG